MRIAGFRGFRWRSPRCVEVRSGSLHFANVREGSLRSVRVGHGSLRLSKGSPPVLCGSLSCSRFLRVSTVLTDSVSVPTILHGCLRLDIDPLKLSENDGGPKRRGKCGRQRCDLRPEARRVLERNCWDAPSNHQRQQYRRSQKKRDNGILPLAVVGDVAKETECCGQLAATGTAERSREDNSKAQRQGKKGGCRQGQSRSPHVPRVRRNWAPSKVVPSLRTEQ